MSTVSEVQGHVAVVRAETSKFRAQTDVVLIATETVCLVGISVAGWFNFGVMVTAFGFLMLACVLGRIQIAIANVGQDIYQGLRELRDDDAGS